MPNSHFSVVRVICSICQPWMLGWNDFVKNIWRTSSEEGSFFVRDGNYISEFNISIKVCEPVEKFDKKFGLHCISFL